MLLDTSAVLFEEEIELEQARVKPRKNSTKERNSPFSGSVNSQDYLEDSLLKYKEQGKKMNADNLYWQGIDPYYTRMDSMSVDPYRYDATKFKDTLQIKLYDTVPDFFGVFRQWSMPLHKGHHVTSKFGHRRSKWHYGDDLGLSIGDSVTSTFDGVVRVSKYNPGGYGNYVIVRHHNGFETLYGHMTKRLVKVGQKVSAGDLVGWGGNTGRSSGPHLHFEVRFRGKAIDPNIMFDFANNRIRYQTFELSPLHFEYIREMRRRMYYRVRRGDTLFAIARRYHVSWRQIARLNRISSRSTLRVGQRLRVR